jgi:hypothetical protein
VSDERDLAEAPSTSATRCAQCGGLLPAPDDVLVIVRPSDGEAISTCSAACMAEWLNQGTVGLRSSIRRSMGTRWSS